MGIYLKFDNMSTIIVHTESEEQDKAVKAALELLNVTFEDDVDETDYINASPAMVARIEQSDKDVAEGKVVKIDLNDLWK